MSRQLTGDSSSRPVPSRPVPVRPGSPVRRRRPVFLINRSTEHKLHYRHNGSTRTASLITTINEPFFFPPVRSGQRIHRKRLDGLSAGHLGSTCPREPRCWFPSDRAGEANREHATYSNENKPPKNHGNKPRMEAATRPVGWIHRNPDQSQPRRELRSIYSPDLD